MNLKENLIFVVLLSSNFLMVFPADPQPLVLLGSVDSRSFHAEVKNRMNWTDAKAHCQSFGMQLASVQTVNQINLLIQKLEEFGPNYNWYWTSARESRHPSMMLWHDTQMEPDMKVLQTWGDALTDEPYHYCGYFIPDKTNPQFWTNLCTRDYRVLCMK